MELSKKEVENYNKIIASSVWSYVRETGNNNLDVEELIQECWMQVLEYNHKHGEMPDYGLTKIICKDTLVDNTRKEYRRNHISLDQVSSGDKGDHNDWIADHNHVSVTDISESEDLLNMFDKDTMEYKWLQFYYEKSGIKDFGIRPPLSKNHEGYTDSACAKWLGIPGGTGNAVWKRLNRKMKGIVADYYG